MESVPELTFVGENLGNKHKKEKKRKKQKQDKTTKKQEANQNRSAETLQIGGGGATEKPLCVLVP